MIHASNPVATHCHVEFYTNNKREEVILEMKTMNTNCNKNTGKLLKTMHGEKRYGAKY